MKNAKAIPFVQLMATLKKLGADEIEDITIEQVTQLHNSVLLTDSVGHLSDELKAAAQNNTELSRDVTVDRLSNIHMAMTSLSTSLGIPMAEVIKSTNAKIVAANQPAKVKTKSATKEKQTDIEDAK